MNLSDIDIVILGHHSKPIITKYHMNQLLYQIYMNEDWEPVPFKASDQVRGLSSLGNEPGPFRCFRGHQEAIKLIHKDVGLIFEDDAVPNTTNWEQTVGDACDLLGEYDIVSLHARNIGPIAKRFKHRGSDYCTLSPTTNNQITNTRWAIAALAYIVGRDFGRTIAAQAYEGVPWDIFIYNCNACILLSSPFDHNRKYGSAIEGRMHNLGIQRGV